MVERRNRDRRSQKIMSEGDKIKSRLGVGETEIKEGKWQREKGERNTCSYGLSMTMKM